MLRKIVLLLLILIFLYIPLSGKVNKQAADLWLSKDKFSHLTASAFLFCWHYEILNNVCQIKRGQSQVLAISLTEFYGLIKEIYDSKKKCNHFSYKDLIFDTLGNFLGLMLYQSVR